MIDGLRRATQHRVYGRFFHMYPRRRVCVSQWLSDWIKRGAVPMVTLNLQKAVTSGYMIPDAWHHQMVFGVSQQGRITVDMYSTRSDLPTHCVVAKSLFCCQYKYNYLVTYSKLLNLNLDYVLLQNVFKKVHFQFD